MEKKCLEVGGLGHGRVYGMIRSLKALTEQSCVSTSLSCSPCDHVAQSVCFQMMGAGAGHEHASRTDQVKAQLVDALIGLKSLTGVFFALDEGRRIQTDDVEGASLPAQIGKKRERVALKRFRLRAELFGIAAGIAQRVGRSIQKADFSGAVSGGECSEAAGVAEGGRTGLTALTAAVLFILSIFLSPIFLAIPGFATTPALVVVGMLMMSSVSKVKFEGDMADVMGAFVAIMMMPFTYSIANGIMFGVLTWLVLKVVRGKFKEIHPIMWVVGALFVLRIITIILGISS